MPKQNLIATVLKTEYKWLVDLPQGLSSLQIEAMRKGFQEWLQDAASTAKPQGDDAQNPAYSADPKSDEYKAFMLPIRNAAVKERCALIQNGSYKPKGSGSGGGGTLTAQQRGWIAYFAARGHKEANRPVSRNTLQRAIDWRVREVLLNYYDPGTKERQDMEQNLADKMAQHRDSIIKQLESNPSDVGGFIEIEKQKDLKTQQQAEPTKPEISLQ